MPLDEIKLLQDALDELEEHEWTHDTYLGVESNVCFRCGASEKGTKIPESHAPGCTWDSVVKRLRERLRLLGVPQ